MSNRPHRGQDIAMTFEVLATKPFDSRQTIKQSTDRLIPATWVADDGNYYVYPSMPVFTEDGKLFIYIGRAGSVDDIQDPYKWVEIGAGSGGQQGGGSPVLIKYSMGEYLQLKEAGALTMQFYPVYKDGELYRFYLQDVLIGKKAEDGEEITVGGVFPLVFPIIFA